MTRAVLGIDPGITTGISLVVAGDVVSTREAFDAMIIGKLILTCNEKYGQGENEFHVVIEDFVGSGRRSRYGVHTIKLVGWLQNFCKWHGISGGLHVPQRRRYMLKNATAIIRRKNLHKTPHTIDATGHALAYWEAWHV